MPETMRTVTVFSVENNSGESMVDLVIIHPLMTDEEVKSRLRSVALNESTSDTGTWEDLADVKNEAFLKYGLTVVSEPHPFIKVDADESL